MHHRILTLGSLLLMLVGFSVPMARSESTIANLTAGSNSAIPSMTPYDVVFLAYQGYFRNQGLRGYGAFADGCNQGKLTAQDVVEAAIKANQLPKTIVNNRGFMNAVDANMKAFKNNSGS
ncbi:MAG: hypothetical protein KME43_25435 [Myxacorys chilensis ATA2-1-KO14]|jgi:hypothetical protein|nr:hypothetical protein [Myxacorys chilensis ATA2-1-KO14]